MAKNYDDIGGVWRTVGGRHIFIKDGQDLASAMKESGKFKNTKKKEKDTRTQKELLEDRKKFEAKMAEKYNDKEAKEFDEKYQKRMHELAEENNDKFYTKKDGTKVYDPYKGTPYEIKYDNAVEALQDPEHPTNKYLREKAEKENLPIKTEIKEQGKSNRKEVSENIQAHILEYYDSPEDFIQQMDAMDYLPTKWRAGEEIAKGGSYLVYNQDMADFLDELKINPKGKKFSSDKSFDMYTSLIGRESEKLYNRLKRNAYNKYMKEHPNSKMTFEDFKDMEK